MWQNRPPFKQHSTRQYKDVFSSVGRDSLPQLLKLALQIDIHVAIRRHFCIPVLRARELRARGVIFCFMVEVLCRRLSQVCSIPSRMLKMNILRPRRGDEELVPSPQGDSFGLLCLELMSLEQQEFFVLLSGVSPVQKIVPGM